MKALYTELIHNTSKIAKGRKVLKTELTSLQAKRIFCVLLVTINVLLYSFFSPESYVKSVSNRLKHVRA